jgi:hypothetical protein
MAKFTERKTGHSTGTIAGVTTPAAGKYTDEELLRRVTLANLLFESNYYQTVDDIMDQIENLVPKVKPQAVVDLALECRYAQKLRHTPLWLLLLVNQYHKGHPIKDAIAKVCNRPDMLMDMLGMLKVRNGKIKPIPKGIKNGLALAFDNYDEYQIAKYKKANMDLSLVDVVNLVHPVATPRNEKALEALVKGTLEPADTWETALSQGKDKKETFLRLIEEEKMGSMAILRNLRGMKEADISRPNIKKAISQVKSQWLTPLNFLAAQRAVPEFTVDLDDAMKRSFANYQIPGTTIVAVDVSGSMGQLTSGLSNFNRMDLAFAMAALATHVFEDLILVFTAGSDSARRGDHATWSNGKGLGIFGDYRAIYSKLGGGGIFTYQLCEWLKKEGHAKEADRLVVISDSQDIDVGYGRKDKPDTSPYESSYIIDISTHTHGIKTGVWTAEINGWSDKLFHYIAALEAPAQ